jgi:hypothetical protein
MKKKLIIIIFCLSSLSTSFGAAIRDWEKEYKDLCSYDNKFCAKLKNSDGTFVRPKKEIVALLKELAPYIEKSAKQLGVDPRAIAGSIMAENSLNVGISDGVQNLLVKIGVANKGEVLGKKFSYGLGQLNFAAAREAEDHVAKIENRPPRNDTELSEAITIPEKSIYLVGAVIRKVQDDYKKEGIDISKRPEVLTTLYNLGKSEMKAAETKRSGNLPKPNFFGYFVDKYMDELAFLKPASIDSTSPAKATAVAPVVASVGKKNSAISASTVIPMKVAAPVIQKLTLAFSKSMPLYSSPPTCSDGQSYGATDIQKKYESMKAFSVTAVADKNKTFKSLVPTVDCEANAWQLIELESGEVGWIKKDDLEKNTAKFLVDDKKCKTTVDAKCSAKVSEQLKQMKIDYPEKSSGKDILARPYSLSSEVAFVNADWSCINKPKETAESSGHGSASTPTPVPTSSPGGFPTFQMQAPKPPRILEKKISIEDLNLLVKSVHEKQKEIEEKYHSPIFDPLNPYSGVDFESMKKGVTYCLNKQKYNLSNCQIDKTTFESFMNSLGTSQKLTGEDRDLIRFNAIKVMSGATELTTPDQLQKMKQSMLSWGMPSSGGFGMNYEIADTIISDQYKLRDGDESKWSMDDIKVSLLACSKSFEKLTLEIDNSSKINPNEKMMMKANLNSIKTGSVDIANNALTEIDKIKDDVEKKSVWEKSQPSFIPLSKMCLSLDDLFDLKKEQISSTVANEYTCFYGSLNVLESANELMLKELIKENSMTTQGVMNLATQFQFAFNYFTPAALNLLPAGGGMGMGMNMGYGIPMEKPTPPASYCPNKTAELIEDIMKNNSCIQHVYLPDKWMVNRLNELGDKVVYRPFEKEDQFAFDVEKSQCN